MTIDVVIVLSLKDTQIRTPKKYSRNVYIIYYKSKKKITTFYSNVRLHSKYTTTVDVKYLT